MTAGWRCLVGLGLGSLRAGCVDIVVAVVPTDLLGAARALLPEDVVVVAGGASRQASVAASEVVALAKWRASAAIGRVTTPSAVTTRMSPSPTCMYTMNRSPRRTESPVVP